MIFSTAGSKFYIGGQMQLRHTDFIASDFSGQAWTEIMGHENLGSIGDSAAELEVKQNRDLRTKRLKGQRTGTTMELICTLDSEDDGQLALIDGEKFHYANFAFRMVFPDAPIGGTPSERLFIATIGSLTEQFDDADFTPKLNAALWVNSNIVRINAAE